jgi:hypothetical protein
MEPGGVLDGVGFRRGGRKDDSHADHEKYDGCDCDEMM